MSAVHQNEQEVIGIHQNIAMSVKNLTKSEQILKKNLVTFQKLRKEVKALEAQKKPQAYEKTRVEQKINKLLDNVLMLSDAIEDNFKIQKLAFVLKKVIFGRVLNFCFQKVASYKGSNKSAQVKRKSPSHLPKFKLKMISHPGTNNLKIKKLLLARIWSIYCTHKVVKNKHIPNPLCLQAQVMARLRSLRLKSELLKSYSTLHYDIESFNRQKKALAFTQYNILTKKQLGFKKLKGNAMLQALSRKLALKKLENFSKLDLNLNKAQFSKLMRNFGDVETYSQNIKESEYLRNLTKFHEISYKLTQMKKTYESKTHLFDCLRINQLRNETSRRGTPLYSFKTALNRTKSAVTFIEAVLNKIDARFKNEFFSNMVRLMFVQNKKALAHNFSTLEQNYIFKVRALNMEIDVCRQEEAFLSLQGLFQRSKRQAFGKIQLSSYLYQEEEVLDPLVGFQVLSKLVWKKKGDLFDCLKRGVLEHLNEVKKREIQNEQAQKSENQRSILQLTYEYENIVQKRQKNSFRMIKNLIQRYSIAREEYSLTQMKTNNSLKNFRLARVMALSNKNHRAMKRFTIRKMRKVGLLPTRKNLNVFSHPNIEAFLAKLQQIKQQFVTRELFFGFKRIKIGKIKPTFEELPFLLFSYYSHLFVKNRKTELKTELFLRLKKISLVKERERVAIAKGKHQEAEVAKAKCIDIQNNLEDKRLKYRAKYLASVFWNYGRLNFGQKESYPAKTQSRLRHALLRWRLKCKFLTRTEKLKMREVRSTHRTRPKVSKLDLNFSRVSKKSLNLSFGSPPMSPINSMKTSMMGILSVLKSSPKSPHNPHRKSKIGRKITFQKKNSTTNIHSPLLSPKTPRRRPTLIQSSLSSPYKVDFSYKRAEYYSPYYLLLYKLGKLERKRKQSAIFEMKWKEICKNILNHEMKFELEFRETVSLKHEINTIQRDLDQNVSKIASQHQYLESKKESLMAKIEKYANMVADKDRQRLKYLSFYALRNLEKKRIAGNFRNYYRQVLKFKIFNSLKYTTKRDRTGRNLIEAYSRIVLTKIQGQKEFAIKKMKQILFYQATVKTEEDLLNERYKAFNAKRKLKRILEWKSQTEVGQLMKNLPDFLYTHRLFSAWKRHTHMMRNVNEEVFNKEVVVSRFKDVKGDRFKQAYKKLWMFTILKNWKKVTFGLKIVPKLDLPAMRLDPSGLIIHSVTSRRHCLSSANRISRLICRRYLDKICTQMAITRFLRVSSSFKKLREHNMKLKTTGLNTIIFTLRNFFLKKKMKSYLQGMKLIKQHAKYGQIFRDKRAIVRQKREFFRSAFNAWKLYTSEQKAIRNELVLENLLISKIQLTYGEKNKARVFNNRLGDISKVYDPNIDELYRFRMLRKTFRSFKKLLKCKNTLRKYCDERYSPFKRLVSLIQPNEIEVYQTAEKNILELRDEADLLKRAEKELTIQARTIKEFVELDNIQRRQNIGKVLKGSLTSFIRFFNKLQMYKVRSAFYSLGDHGYSQVCCNCMSYSQDCQCHIQPIEQDIQQIQPFTPVKNSSSSSSEMEEIENGSDHATILSDYNKPLNHIQIKIMLRNLSRKLNKEQVENEKLEFQCNRLKQGMNKDADEFKDIQR